MKASSRSRSGSKHHHHHTSCQGHKNIPERRWTRKTRHSLPQTATTDLQLRSNKTPGTGHWKACTVKTRRSVRADTTPTWPSEVPKAINSPFELNAKDVIALLATSLVLFCFKPGQVHCVMYVVRAMPRRCRCCTRSAVKKCPLEAAVPKLKRMKNNDNNKLIVEQLTDNIEIGKHHHAESALPIIQQSLCHSSVRKRKCVLKTMLPIGHH